MAHQESAWVVAQPATMPIISDPSRTGEELNLPLAEACMGLSAGEIDFISAHGTATLYNDEMEAKRSTWPVYKPFR